MRKFLVSCLFAVLFGAAPAHAQFFLKPYDLTSPPVTGAEPGIITQLMPNAKPDEQRAALVWSVRAALNVAALQCQFEPTLLTDENYNAMLRNHREELADSYKAIATYYERENPKNKRAAQTALDQFNTRIYSGFSTVSAQLMFCLTAESIGREVVFTPRGSLHTVALRRMRELRGSLVPWGEQQFYGWQAPELAYAFRVPAAFGQPNCWRKDEWQPKRCGPPFQGEAPRRR
ncbi:hypothetical protein ACNI3Q_11620 [Sphingomonas sp. FW199]|uniref:hypothetical protein n=1 Tax=Sphingomonas sp. FW199 TaxID=3400217 RepID=UPI003CE8B6BB